MAVSMLIAVLALVTIGLIIGAAITRRRAVVVLAVAAGFITLGMCIWVALAIRSM